MAFYDVNGANQIKTVEMKTINKGNTVINSQSSDEGRETIVMKSKEQVEKQEHRKGERSNSNGKQRAQAEKTIKRTKK